MMAPEPPWIYIAAPYTHPDPVENSHRALMVAETLISVGFIPIVPHLSLMWHLVFPHSVEFWYSYTMEQLRRCDAVLRLSGLSAGADQEVAEARRLDIPIFYTVAQTMEYFNK